MDWLRIGIVGFILALAIATNVFVNVNFPEQADRFPFLGAALWLAIAISIPARSPNWAVLPRSFRVLFSCLR